MNWSIPSRLLVIIISTCTGYMRQRVCVEGIFNILCVSVQGII